MSIYPLKKACILAILAAMPLFSAAAQTLSDVPIYIPDGIYKGYDSDRADVKFYQRIFAGGSDKLVPGERVVWRYPFPTKAREINGQRVEDLHQDSSTMTYILSNQTHIKVEIRGMIASIKIPRNCGPLQSLFNFADVSLQNATKPIVLHRLGNPDKVSEEDGKTCFLYSSVVTKERTRYETARGSATGKINIDGFQRDIELDTETSIPIEEKITFQPYCFKVYFDQNDNVCKVEDLVDRTATWVKKP